MAAQGVEETVEAMLSSVRLEQYQPIFEQEGYVFASDLGEAEPEEIEALVEKCEMKRPEARRLAKAIRSRTADGGASSDVAVVTAAAARLTQEARAAKLLSTCNESTDTVDEAKLDRALDSADQSSKSLQAKAGSVESAQARLAAQQAEFEQLQREIRAAEAAVEHRRQELERQRSQQASAGTAKEQPLLDIGDDAVFAAGPKHLTPASLGTPPNYPAQTTEGFLLTPAANEYQPALSGLLTDLPTNMLVDTLNPEPLSTQSYERAPKTSKAALADELGDDGMLDLSSSSSSEEEEAEAKAKNGSDDDDESDVAVNVVSTPPRPTKPSALGFGAAPSTEMPELAESDEVDGSSLSAAGRALLDKKGATNRLGSAQAELVALRAAVAAEREAKDAALSELTTYTVSVIPHPEHGLGITIDEDAGHNAFVEALVNQPPVTGDDDHGKSGTGGLVQGAAERSGVEAGSMILAVNGVNVRGKGTVAVGEEVSKATGVVQLELAALRSDPPSARTAWQPGPDDSGITPSNVSMNVSGSEVQDDSSGQGSSDTPVKSASRSRKRKSAARRKHHHPGGKSQQAGEKAAAEAKQCEVCQCSVKQAMATVRKRGSAEVASAFPTGFREGYCCDCYDKLVEDIKTKKALQAEQQRAKAASEQKAEDEKKEKEARHKASNLPTLDEHFRVHGIEPYFLNGTDPTVPGDSEEDSGEGVSKVSSGGRGVRALRKFPAAVTVWTEPPYVSLLRYERWGTRCQSCFMTAEEATAAAGDKRSKKRKLSACSRCSCVKYCCRDCQMADWPDHKHECAVLKRRAASTNQSDRREDTIDADIMMARIWRRREISTAGTTSNPRKEYARSFAYADVLEEDHLQSHEDGFAKELRADTVSQLPFISSFCPSSKGPASLTAAGLGDVFGRYCTNAFSTYTELMEACALAVYLGLALVNHSCEPNCWAYFENGRNVHVRTLRAIAPGEPLTIAYVNPPATRISRRAQLKTNYFFDCNCDRCEKEGAAMESAEAVGPPQTVKAASESDSCADRVAQAGEILKAGDYEEALCLLLGDEDIDEHSSGGLSQREHLGMVAGTLGAAVPAMVAEAYEGLALSVRNDYQTGESAQSKAMALRYYEAAAPFFAASLPPLHPMAGIRALEMAKLAASLSKFDLGLQYASKARVVLALCHGLDRPIVRTIDEFVATLKAMVVKTAQANAYQAAMATATDALGTAGK